MHLGFTGNNAKYADLRIVTFPTVSNQFHCNTATVYVYLVIRNLILPLRVKKMIITVNLMWLLLPFYHNNMVTKLSLYWRVSVYGV